MEETSVKPSEGFLVLVEPALERLGAGSSSVAWEVLLRFVPCFFGFDCGADV